MDLWSKVFVYTRTTHYLLCLFELCWPCIVLVPYPKKESFDGRAELLQNLKELAANAPAHSKAALYSLGGIG